MADERNNRISVWTRRSTSSADWTNQSTFGGNVTIATRFVSLTGVFVSEDGLTTWVAAYRNHRISVWTRSSARSTDWTQHCSFGGPGTDDSRLWGLEGRFVSSEHVFLSADRETGWVAETHNHRISVWTSS